MKTMNSNLGITLKDKTLLEKYMIEYLDGDHTYIVNIRSYGITFLKLLLMIFVTV